MPSQVPEQINPSAESTELTPREDTGISFVNKEAHDITKLHEDANNSVGGGATGPHTPISVVTGELDNKAFEAPAQNLNVIDTTSLRPPQKYSVGDTQRWLAEKLLGRKARTGKGELKNAA
jgi:hypothetical protein